MFPSSIADGPAKSRNVNDIGVEERALGGQGRKFGDVCGEEFSAPARRERRAYPSADL